MYFSGRRSKDGTIQNFQNCCVVFNDMLDSNQKLIDPFFTRGRHDDLDVYCLTKSDFDLPKRTIGKISKILILFQQTLKNVEHIFRDKAGFVMSYDEFKQLCREAWKEKYNYLIINRLEDKNGKNIGFVMNLIRSIKSIIHKRILSN